MQPKETKKIQPEEGENGAYLFPEINNPDFEKTISLLTAEIEALEEQEEFVEKAVSTESVSEAKRRGLVPQSGDWEKPRRWVRPEDADVPVDGGEKPRKKASEDLVISSETKEAMKFIFGDSFDISDFQDMYSIGLEGFSTEITELQQDLSIGGRTIGTKLRIRVKINVEEEQYSPGIVTEEEERILHLTRRDADFERFRIDRQNLISRIRREEGISTLVNIMEGNRDAVGTMVRSFSRENTVRGEEFIVTHDSFSLPTSFQGQGIAADINEHVEEEYEKLGVDAISLSANASIGGYAWAKQGYDFNSDYAHRKPDDLEKMKGHFILYLKTYTDATNKAAFPEGVELAEGVDLDSAIEQVQGFTHAWEFANFNPNNREDGNHLGKSIMLGTDWRGKKSLDKKSLGYQIGKAYFAAKRNEKNVS